MGRITWDSRQLPSIRTLRPPTIRIPIPSFASQLESSTLKLFTDPCRCRATGPLCEKELPLIVLIHPPIYAPASTASSNATPDTVDRSSCGAYKE